MNQDKSNASAPANGSRPIFLSALYLHCGHCDRWAPSHVKYWYFEGFERARQRGGPNCCRRCGKATPANQQPYRAFLENGDCREGG